MKDNLIFKNFNGFHGAIYYSNNVDLLNEV